MKSKVKGFTLIELIIALCVAASIFFALVTYLMHQRDDIIDIAACNKEMVQCFPDTATCMGGTCGGEIEEPEVSPTPPVKPEPTTCLEFLQQQGEPYEIGFCGLTTDGEISGSAYPNIGGNQNLCNIAYNASFRLSNKVNYCSGFIGK